MLVGYVKADTLGVNRHNIGFLFTIPEQSQRNGCFMAEHTERQLTPEKTNANAKVFSSMTWWHHQWKHFLALCKGIHRSPVNSLHKGEWRGTLMSSLIFAWTNDWVNNRDAGDLRHHRAHYDVTVINWNSASPHSRYFLIIIHSICLVCVLTWFRYCHADYIWMVWYSHVDVNMQFPVCVGVMGITPSDMISLNDDLAYSVYLIDIFEIMIMWLIKSPMTKNLICQSITFRLTSNWHYRNYDYVII